MNGCDAITFTAGIGENDAACVRASARTFLYAGIVIDPEKNKIRGKNVEISSARIQNPRLCYSDK